MNIKSHQSNIRTIRQGDDRFILQDKYITCPRAGFEISQRCPENYRSLIQECINHGWIKPVAYVYGRELTMDALR